MENTLVWLLIGAGAGYVMGQVLILFFSDEIFNFMDRLVNRVRRMFGLPRW